MDKMSPIPGALWTVTPDSVVEALVTPVNLRGAIMSLWGDIERSKPEGNLVEIYAKKVDILLNKTTEILKSSVDTDYSLLGSLEDPVTDLAWSVGTDVSKRFVRENDFATAGALYRAAARDSVHNLFDVLSKEEIESDLTYVLAMTPSPGDTGSHQEIISYCRTTQAVRNLVWHEVKRGEIANAKFLVDLSKKHYPCLVLGTPFFQEGVWDNIPVEERSQFQYYLHNSMRKREQDISIRFAWLAGTPEGQEYIENVSSKFKPKAYRPLQSGLKAWQRDLKSSNAAHLVRYLKVNLLGGSPGGHLYWDFNPFGEKLYDILETALLATQSISPSIDAAIAGHGFEIKGMLLHSGALQDIEETVAGYKWDLSKFSSDSHLTRCIYRLLMRRKPAALDRLPTALLSQLAEGLSCKEFSDKLELYAGGAPFSSFPTIDRPVVRVDAETFFDKGWLETLKDPDYQGARFKVVIRASSARGAKLTLESMQTTGGRPCLIDRGGDWITAVHLKSVLEHAEDKDAAKVAWEYFDSWAFSDMSGIDVLVTSWFRAFAECGFFQEVTADKTAEFWEQFIEVYKTHHSHLTPAAILSLTEAATS